MSSPKTHETQMEPLTGIQLELNLRDVGYTSKETMNELQIDSNPVEKLPTLPQFLKAQGKKKLAGQYPVLKVWKPGKFPNYSLETEKFRISISENNPMFLPFGEFLDQAVESGSGFAVAVNDDRKGGFRVLPLSDNWDVEPLGDRGFKFTAVSRG